MVQKLKLLAIMPPNTTTAPTCTAYFFNKSERLLLPIELSVHILSSLLESVPPDKPNIHEATEKIIKTLGGRIVSVTIHFLKNDAFYTHIQIKRFDRIYNINLDISDAVCLAVKCKCPIFVKKEVLAECGMLVTRRMVEEALIQS